MFRTCTILLVCLMTFTASAGDTYQFDTVHSSVMFSVAHNTVGMAHGRFNTYDGAVEYDGDTPTSVKVTIETESIDSGDAKRDGHLRKPDFFNAAEFPQITFTSTSVKADGDKLEVTGDLTMVGTTKPVTFHLTQKGPVDGRGGAKIRGLHGQAVINRSDFGMSYGIPGIGDEVTISVALEVVAK